jgi:N-acetylglucosaminyldiphosphoundecaprenol N-acetyl-beta-D-mannosaminyltransferase
MDLSCGTIAASCSACSSLIQSTCLVAAPRAPRWQGTAQACSRAAQRDSRRGSEPRQRGNHLLDRQHEVGSREPAPKNANSSARVELLGVEVDALSADQFQALVQDAVVQGKRCIVANHNLHSVYLFHRDLRMRMFYALAAQVLVDGMALVFLGRLLGKPLYRAHRVAAVDWIYPLAAECARRGWRVFFLGSKPGVWERARHRLVSMFPGLSMKGAPGYFSVDTEGPENRQIIERINCFRPQVLLVGMGMPRQEHWILENWPQLQADVVLNVGACMDFVAGAVPAAPRWLGRCGLEWAWRLANEPRRLWRRYLVEPWFIAGLLLRDLRRPRRAGRGAASVGRG